MKVNPPQAGSSTSSHILTQKPNLDQIGQGFDLALLSAQRRDDPRPRADRQPAGRDVAVSRDSVKSRPSRRKDDKPSDNGNDAPVAKTDLGADQDAKPIQGSDDPAVDSGTSDSERGDSANQVEPKADATDAEESEKTDETEVQVVAAMLVQAVQTQAAGRNGAVLEGAPVEKTAECDPEATIADVKVQAQPVPDIDSGIELGGKITESTSFEDGVLPQALLTESSEVVESPKSVKASVGSHRVQIPSDHGLQPPAEKEQPVVEEQVKPEEKRQTIPENRIVKLEADVQAAATDAKPQTTDRPTRVVVEIKPDGMVTVTPMTGDHSNRSTSSNASAMLGQVIQQHNVDDANVERVSRALQTAVNQKGGTVSLRLEPPELGIVRVKMDMAEGMVRAQFMAEHESVRQLLTNQLGQLRQALESQGLVVDRLSVQVLSPAPAGFAHQGGSGPEDGMSDGRSRNEYAGRQGDFGQGRQDTPNRDSPDRLDRDLVDLVV